MTENQCWTGNLVYRAFSWWAIALLGRYIQHLYASVLIHTDKTNFIKICTFQIHSLTLQSRQIRLTLMTQLPYRISSSEFLFLRYEQNIELRLNKHLCIQTALIRAFQTFLYILIHSFNLKYCTLESNGDMLSLATQAQCKIYTWLYEYIPRAHWHWTASFLSSDTTLYHVWSSDCRSHIHGERWKAHVTGGISFQLKNLNPI